MRSRLSERDAAQELDAGWVLNEGRCWNFVEQLWPAGNLIDSGFDISAPWGLGVDLGGANSAWGLYQIEYAVDQRTGERIQLLVCKAEWTPHDQAPWIVIEEIKDFTRLCRFRKPMWIKIGADYKTPGGTGYTSEHMFDAAGWGSVVETITGDLGSKDIQHRQAAYLIESSDGVRRFCVSTKLKSHYTGKTRGIMDMLRHDTFPEPGSSHYFRKEKTRGIYHEDSRDQWLYACVGVFPPAYRPQMTYPR
jgi:hypothetical protein